MYSFKISWSAGLLVLSKDVLSTAYPPLIHPIKDPLNRGILLDTSDGKTGKLLTGTTGKLPTGKQANFRESIGPYWSDNGVVTGKTTGNQDKCNNPHNRFFLSIMRIIIFRRNSSPFPEGIPNPYRRNQH